MEVWLVDPYGPIPEEGWREYRYTMVGEELAARGHRVIWWTANFSHYFKRYRSRGWQNIDARPGFTIRLVPTCSYRKNICLRRIAFELIYGLRLLWAARSANPPDLIFCVNPPQNTTFMAVLLAKWLGVRIVVDVFDLWPELFELVAPRLFRPLARFAFLPLYALRHWSLSRADGVVAVCEDYLERAKKAAGPSASPATAVFFIGVDVAKIREARLNPPQVRKFAGSVGKKPGDIWAILAGTLGNNSDIDTILRASRLLRNRAGRVTILVAGEGPLRPVIEKFLARNPDAALRCLGPLSPRELERYYQVSDLGLSSYVEGSPVAMPTRIYDYLAAGLPIVNSLPGEVDRLIRRSQIGAHYEAGNPESLCAALSGLAADPLALAEMSRRAEAAAQLFDKNRQYAGLGDFLETLVSRPVAASAAPEAHWRGTEGSGGVGSLTTE